MGKGQRPGNEYAQETMKRRHPSSSSSIPSPTWPEMRVVRQADINDTTVNGTWDVFLKHLGQKNYGKGKASSLGSMAVVYVPAVEMGRMLAERYPRDYETRTKTIDLQRKVAEGIRNFTRSAFSEEYHSHTESLEASNFLVRMATRGFEFSNELEGADPIYPTGSMGMPAVAVRQPRFSAAVVEVAGIELFGKDGMGLNLTPNNILYEERDALAGYLRRYEGLNTSFLNRGWQAHATTFTFEQHIAAASLRFQRSIPAQIALDAPRPIIS